MKKTIIIFGGGISGLTIAHELIEKGFRVKLFEKDKVLGGMARSRREINGIPSEHSWRGYAPFYKNFFNIARRIPVDKDKSVYDNLSLPIEFYLLRDRISTYKPKLNILDYIVIFYYSLKYLFSNERRYNYYKIKLLPLLKNKLSENGYDFLIEFILGPGLGMEKKDGSYAHFFKVLMLQTFNQKKYVHKHIFNGHEYYHYARGNWHVMNQPTSEAWFNSWRKYLIDEGVEIYLNTELIKINYHNNRITSCIVNNGYRNEEVVGDEYVLCINPFEAEKIFRRSNMNFLYNQHKLINKNTISNQISFRIGFNKKINFPAKNIAFTMTDSEFNITWYPQEKYWPGIKLDNKNVIKSLWSGTILVAYKKGKLYDKFAIRLNKQEFMNEIVYQILRSKSLQKLIYENNRFYLKKKDIVYTEIWYEWKVINNILVPDNKKWVNNIYNQEFRPLQKTSFQNLYLGGAHTKTTIDIWSMEGAVESGKEISNYISKKYNKGNVIKYEHNDSIYLQPFKFMDDILYKLRIPNIVDIILTLLSILIIYYIYINYKRW